MIPSIPRPAHRLERLQHWMAAEGIDCAIALGADNVNHLCGYWRYFGGPSALIVGADGERTLIVMRDEVPIATTLSDADEVLGYGERGFGINLDPLTDLVSAVTSVPAVARAGRIGVDLETQTITSPSGQRHSFEVDPRRLTAFATRVNSHMPAAAPSVGFAGSPVMSM